MPALAPRCSRAVIVVSPGSKGDLIFDHPGDRPKVRTTLQAEEHEPEGQRLPGPGGGTIQPGARPPGRGSCRDAAGEIRQAAAVPRDTLAVVRAAAAPWSEEYQMSVFTVDLKNQPGELARLCEAMAGRGINLVLSATPQGKTAPWCSSPTTRPARRPLFRTPASGTGCAWR